MKKLIPGNLYRAITQSWSYRENPPGNTPAIGVRMGDILLYLERERRSPRRSDDTIYPIHKRRLLVLTGR